MFGCGTEWSIIVCCLWSTCTCCSAETVLFCGKCERTVFCLPLHFSPSASAVAADDVDADVDADADFAATAKCALAISSSFGSEKVSVFSAALVRFSSVQRKLVLITSSNNCCCCSAAEAQFAAHTHSLRTLLSPLLSFAVACFAHWTRLIRHSHCRLRQGQLREGK